MPHSRDLFDDSTMTFGEHLEALRVHMWKAVIGLLLCVIVSLHPLVAENVIGLIRMPLDRALAKAGVKASDDDAGIVESFQDWVGRWFGGAPEEADAPPSEAGGDSQSDEEQQARSLPEASGDPRIDSLRESVHELSERVAALTERVEILQDKSEEPISPSPVALNVQEPFLIYLKVAFVSGFVIASPWVFYQLWLFVAAGLYPHERKYVYIYLPISLLLFATGALFCFFAVFPFVLTFLMGFNVSIGVELTPRLSEWISFAIMLPVMFGLSFELPLVMLFLERISIFEERDYREKRRMAILVIAIVSMFMTPADPMSMLMMMFPLLLLYELGILMCRYSPSNSPFGAEAA
ncbi:MAG: twin-arginine translocase subunit TatC [Planctomycetales bacterium]